MTFTSKLLIANFAFLLSSCSTFQQPKVDYIIYGSYAGECMKHCTLMFKLDSSYLIADTSDSFFDNMEKTVSFLKSDTLSESDFRSAEEIKRNIPGLLFKSSSKSFGDPDGHDQGGIFVQFKTDDGIKTFYIDVEDDKIPKELISFTNLIGKNISSKWNYYYH